MYVQLFPWKISKSGSVRGYQGVQKPYFESFLPIFYEFFCVFLQFHTLESCYVWFTISLEYLIAYVYSCCPGKVKNGSVRGYQGVRKPYFEPFLPTFWDFLSFLQFSTLESCYIWFTISLEYFNAYVNSCCPEKIQKMVCQGLSGGTKTLFWAILSYFFEIFCFFFSFLHWNNIIFGLKLV